MGDPARAETMDGRPHAARAGHLARVRRGGQPGVAGDGERGGERFDREDGLVPGQPEGVHAPTRVPAREPGQIHRRVRTVMAHRRQGQPEPHTVADTGLPPSRQREFQHLRGRPNSG